MKTLIKIAWRNVWRNKLRSSVVILSIILGLWAGLFTMALCLGLNQQRIDNTLRSHIAHVQIHHPKFLETNNPNDTITNHRNIYSNISKNKLVKAASKRLIVFGMGSTNSGDTDIKVNGIDPEKEINISNVNELMIKGTYLKKTANNIPYSTIIGKGVAKKLNIDLEKENNKITFIYKHKKLDTILLNVTGIYKTSNTSYDQTNIFVNRNELNDHISNKEIVHEIAIGCHSIENAKKLKEIIAPISPNNKVQTWKELKPELAYANEMMSSFIYIFMIIILIALSFGIINTMLMAVLERKRELGMLMSVGMNKKNIFFIIILETLFISLVAMPVGLILSYIIISYFKTVGIDLSIVGEGMESFGVGTIVYPELPLKMYVNISIMTLSITFLSSFFPAKRALKLNPAEAVRSL